MKETLHNYLFQKFFPHFFAKVTCEIRQAQKLQNANESGTIIYISKPFGFLENSYYRYLLKKQGLPVFSAKKSVSEQVLADKSTLISLPPSSLEDEELFFSYSKQALTALLLHRKKTAQPIYLVPLEFVWDKRPGQEYKTIIDLIFGSKENPGPLRKWMLFFRHYKSRSVAHIGKPLALEDLLLNDNENIAKQALHLRKRLLQELRIEHRTTTGPPMRPRTWFIEQVLSDELLNQQLAKLAVQNNQPLPDVMILAKSYIKEIASNMNLRSVELYSRLISWLFRSLYDRIIFDAAQIDKLKELAAKQAVVLVVNHKSHVDYLILSHLLNKHNMTVPHIAAGKNLAFWPLGPIFRRGGAYFIRRKFRENKAYRFVLEAYLRTLIKAGYSQEFFIEGARSRSGKLMSPRMGMLSMLLSSAENTQTNNLSFVSVAITYDQVIEQKSHLQELKGAAKQNETRRDLFRLGKLLKPSQQSFGSIHINFGQALAAEDYHGKISKRTTNLANDLCHQINRKSVITPATITATALLSFYKRGVPKEKLQSRAKLFLDYLYFKDAPLSAGLKNNTSKILAESLEMLTANKNIIYYADPEFPFYAISEEKRLALDYFKNGAIHRFVSISIIARLIAEQNSPFTPQDLLDRFNFYRELFIEEFKFSTRLEPIEHIETIFIFLEQSSIIEKTTHGFLLIEKSQEKLNAFKNLLLNFFESYKLILTSILRSPANIDEAQLLHNAKQLGEKMLLLEKLTSAEALSKWNLKNALAAFVRFGLVSKNAGFFSLSQKTQAEKISKIL